MEFLKISVFIFVCLPCIFASKCSDVSGSWVNELGSRMFLEADANGHITGEFKTAVESQTGAASVVSKLGGVFVQQKDGSQLAFSVLFNHGSSIATWVGQCLACEEKEVLYTTYILHSAVPDPKQRWKSVVVNQNTFRRQGLESVPSDVLSELVESKPRTVLNITGIWKSTGREEIEILKKLYNISEDLLIKGKWKSHDNKDYELHGIGDSLRGTHLVSAAEENRKPTALAMMTVGNGIIRSWTGHAFAEPHASVNTLETAWLEHKYEPSCFIPRGLVRFGMTNFTKTADLYYTLEKAETFLDKLRKFFTSMF